MIKKLEKHIGTTKVGNITYDAMKPASINEMHEKINELVDAVNKLDALLDLTNTAIQAINKTEPEHIADVSKTIDPYAEQRKWIGKVCRFWNDDESLEDSMYGELVNIYDVPHEDNPFQCGYGEWYAYCEPVKPDDDIIYKGGDNE